MQQMQKQQLCKIVQGLFKELKFVFRYMMMSTHIQRAPLTSMLWQSLIVSVGLLYVFIKNYMTPSYRYWLYLYQSDKSQFSG